jgi:hypothetical protein
MDGLLQLAGNTGSGDGQAGEASFVQIATPCFNNENCLDNDVCAVQGSATFFCASGTLGDPNGSNIEDLATAIDSLGTAGRGNLMTSLRSTKCVDGGADDLYPFDGGYVDN